MRQTFLSMHQRCSASLNGCDGMATDIHHKSGRIGELLLDTTKWIAVCRSCHTYIESHPDFSKTKNLSNNRL